MDEDALNMSIRKFLKQVGVTSQREIETKARDADKAGKTGGVKSVKATVTVSVPELGVSLTINDDLALE